LAFFSYKTQKNSEPKGKPKVFFTCHPKDFELYFEKISEDILTTHDCTIYYTKDMTETIEEENLDADLGQINLFVVPVTSLLLTTPNRAMDNDIAYAKKNHIPVLPFMMESGLNENYSATDKFDKIQYLDLSYTDPTQIPYEEKLKKQLDIVLISNEIANRIRAAFDAYIFLSYRKKDRKYANELMKLIHKNPECRDIAIWFDEFLAPGENFLVGIHPICRISQFLPTKPSVVATI